MKKRFLLCYFVIILFFIGGVVKAKDNPFVLDWKNEDEMTSYEFGAIIDTNLAYDKGYVTIQLDMNYDTGVIKTVMRNYDLDGKTLKEKQIKNSVILDGVTDGTYIYVLQVYESYRSRVASYMPLVSIVKYDMNFKVVNEYEFTEEDLYDTDERFLMISAIAKNYGLNSMSLVDNNLYLLQYGYGMFKIDTGLENLSSYSPVYNPENTRVRKYFENYYDIATISEDIELGIASLDKNEKYIAYSGSTCTDDIAWSLARRDNVVTGVNPIVACDERSYVGLLDSNGKEIWEKELKDYYILLNVKIINDYVVSLGIMEGQTEIVVYDLEGNVVQIIESDQIGYLHITPSASGFIVSNNVIDRNNCNYGVAGQSSVIINSINTMQADDSMDDLYQCPMYTTTEVYQIPFNIEVKVEGKGKVEVSSESFADLEQSIVTKANFGYKLKEIRITDKDGNVIELKNGKFIMPASDVTIEVIFDVENPNTADIAIIGTIVAGIGFGIFGITRYRKLKFLK